MRSSILNSRTMRSATLILAGAVVVPWLVATPAAAQDSNALSQRLDRLERDIQTLQKMVVRGPDSVPAKDIPAVSPAPAANLPQNAVARIGVRLDALENDLRDVTGRLEEMSYKLNQLNQRVDRLAADTDFRLTGLEQKAGLAHPPKAADAQGLTQGAAAPDSAGGSTGSLTPQGVTVIGRPSGTLGKVDADLVKPAAEGSAVPPAGAQDAAKAPAAQRVTPSAAAAPAPEAPAPSAVKIPSATQQASVPQASAKPAAVLPAGTPDEQYHYAFGLLRKHEFDQAEAAFRAFLDQHKDGPLVSNAWYWLGETHYARAEYVKAAEVFLKGYETNPKGTKAPDSLLKLAVSLGQLGQKKEACGAITKLFADYPSASSSLKRTATRQQHQLGCK